MDGKTPMMLKPDKEVTLITRSSVNLTTRTDTKEFQGCKGPTQLLSIAKLPQNGLIPAQFYLRDPLVADVFLYACMDGCRCGRHVELSGLVGSWGERQSDDSRTDKRQPAPRACPMYASGVLTLRAIVNSRAEPRWWTRRESHQASEFIDISTASSGTNVEIACFARVARLVSSH